MHGDQQCMMRMTMRLTSSLHCRYICVTLSLTQRQRQLGLATKNRGSAWMLIHWSNSCYFNGTHCINCGSSNSSGPGPGFGSTVRLNKSSNRHHRNCYQHFRHRHLPHHRRFRPRLRGPSAQSGPSTTTTRKPTDGGHDKDDGKRQLQAVPGNERQKIGITGDFLSRSLFSLCHSLSLFLFLSLASVSASLSLSLSHCGCARATVTANSNTASRDK